MEKKKIVMVKWLDATYLDDGWQPNDMNFSPVELVSVGFLQKNEPEYITIIQTLADDDDAHINAFTIPRGSIKKITTIKTVNLISN